MKRVCGLETQRLSHTIQGIAAAQGVPVQDLAPRPQAPRSLAFFDKIQVSAGTGKGGECGGKSCKPWVLRRPIPMMGHDCALAKFYAGKDINTLEHCKGKAALHSGTTPESALKALETLLVKAEARKDRKRRRLWYILLFLLSILNNEPLESKIQQSLLKLRLL